jgi:hypothetical protein
MDDPFKFDPNSTKNEGRWRLIDPKKFIKNRGWFRKKNINYPGISYVFGILKDNPRGGAVKQTIRFDKKIWTEKKAAAWWKEHKDDYDREWTEEDWKEWKKEQSLEVEQKKIKPKPIEEKVTKRKALFLSRKIIQALDLEYVNPREITVNTKFRKGIGFPAGSVRQGRDEVGDLDIIITKKISKDKIKIPGITELSGGEKRIDFKYHYPATPVSQGSRQIGVNLFIFLDKKTWGAALLHTTGPWQYNAILRKKVNGFGEGWSLSQNGLVNGYDEIIPTPTERDLQKEIGVTVRTPSERVEFKKFISKK